MSTLNLSPTPASDARYSVLHVIVGHGLPKYFLNAVRSVRESAPADPLLVIDNASVDPDLGCALSDIAKGDELIKLILRTSNDLRENGKVGSLYAAYAVAFDEAIKGDFDMVHLMQADCQMLWWDAEVVARSAEIFEAHPQCVNILTLGLSRDKLLADEIVPASDGLAKLRRYGLTDTGLYHVGRWRNNSMGFCKSEQEHASTYLAAGWEVICHPWPTDAQIPWPAVIRGGVQRGKEVATTKPYLLKPLSQHDVAALKGSAHAWLEDVCIPWGWACASPMWVTSLDSIDYWVLRYRDARRNGLGKLFPRLDSRGVDRSDRRGVMRIYPYRPSLVRLFLTAPASEVARRIRSRYRRAGRIGGWTLAKERGSRRNAKAHL
jgi:hypothetical protein